MDEESLFSKEYCFATCAASLANNSLYSDIQFVLGPEKQKIYGHKNLLSLGSLVFHRMFFGSLKEKNGQIQIPDISPKGFLNMMRYIYGLPVDQIPITELYETFVAGDKYLVCDLNHRLIEFAAKTLNEHNSCTIYNELVKIGDNLQLIEKARRLIKSKTKEAFQDEHFNRIDLDTLIDILNFEWLELEEVQILESCLRWVEAEIECMDVVETNKNKRKVFAAIKRYIRFSDLKPEQLGTFAGIESLLANDEIGELMLHLFNKSTKSSPVHCKTARKCKQAFTVANQDAHVLAAAHSAAGLTTLLNVNRKVLIEKIRTTLGKEINELTLSVYEGDEKLELDHQKLCDEAGVWFFQFDKLLELNSESDYKLVFEFSSFQFAASSGLLSNTPKLTLGEDVQAFVFTLNFEAYHCVKQFDFFGLV